MKCLRCNQVSISNRMDQNWKIYSKIRYALATDLINDIANLPYAIVKGEPLSYFAYNEFGKRKSCDIDILVERINLEKVKSILFKNGYKYIISDVSRKDEIFAATFSHQLIPFRKNINNLAIDIDINYDVFWGEYNGERNLTSEILKETIDIDVYGTTVKTLSPINSFVQLILHHYKEMNSIYHLANHNSINYGMFRDIYYLWKNNKRDITLEKIKYICSKNDILPFAYYILYYTNRIFADAELQMYVNALKCNEGECLLDYYGLTEQERKKWRYSFETRIETPNIYEIIKSDLTENDFKKLEQNIRVFGEI